MVHKALVVFVGLPPLRAGRPTWGEQNRQQSLPFVEQRRAQRAQREPSLALPAYDGVVLPGSPSHHNSISNHKSTDFHPFPRLPPELRRMIWDYAVEAPRLVHTRGFYDQDKARATEIHFVPKFPPLHDACHEGGRAFLESPGLVSETTGLGVARYPKRDFLIRHGISLRQARLVAFPLNGRNGASPW
ncbi:hypothetical protein PG994_001465 [Apiospora phragmitis]|uniref:2EXR domain-containing protein n=1 Tax=Apiospora phragmitis TaxID=2905665 RepID=A0ABR1WTL2_9PEZI